jgi:hypothetical protein
MKPTTASVFRDNTMLSGYKTCPRFFQLRHILNLRPDRAAMPLIFGSCWHSSMDIVWGNAKSFSQTDLRKFATLKFLEKWEEEGMSTELDLETIERLSPRTPSVAEEMLAHYIEQRWDILTRCEVIAIEQPFAVPLPGLTDTWYCGKLDKVIEYNGQKLIIEHKTTTEYKVDGGFKTQYIESWDSHGQIKGYEYGASLYYAAEAVWVDAALVHKKVHDKFRFVPVAHQRSMLDEWIDGTVDWVKKIDSDTKFSKNEENCFGKFGPCMFLDVCRHCPEPRNLEGVPEGYKVEPWSPFETLGLDKLINAGE